MMKMLCTLWQLDSLDHVLCFIELDKLDHVLSFVELVRSNSVSKVTLMMMNGVLLHALVLGDELYGFQ